MSDSDCAQSSPPNVVLYMRSGCHLCDVAQQVLERHGIVPACVDIDDDPQLREKFDTCVPVVEIGGRVRFRGAVHPLLLRRIIQNQFGGGQ